MNGIRALCWGLALLVLTAPQSRAVAPEPTQTPTVHPLPPRATPLREPQPGEEQPAPAPDGFNNFASRYPGEVEDSGIALATPDQVETAHKINTNVNERIIWRPVSVWAIAFREPAYGDCKTYSLTKRHAMRQAGIPDGASRLVVVYAAKYRQKHMVVELRTADRKYILDSLANDEGHHFYLARALPVSYNIMEYQVWGKPKAWVSPPSWVNARVAMKEKEEAAPWLDNAKPGGHGRRSALASRGH
jgi:predicted transglutaminase-like cysteine proteinase